MTKHPRLDLHIIFHLQPSLRTFKNFEKSSRLESSGGSGTTLGLVQTFSSSPWNDRHHRAGLRRVVVPSVFEFSVFRAGWMEVIVAPDPLAGPESAAVDEGVGSLRRAGH